MSTNNAESTAQRRRTAAEALLRQRYSENPTATVSHQELAAVIGAAPPNARYYAAIYPARAAFLAEGIALGTVTTTPDEPGGYRFLSAPLHGERNAHKFELSIDRVENEVLWTEAWIQRINHGEPSGLSRAEELMRRTYANDARRAIDTFRGQTAALQALRADEHGVRQLEAKSKRMMAEATERVSQVREAKQKVIQELRGKLKRQERE